MAAGEDTSARTMTTTMTSSSWPAGASGAGGAPLRLTIAQLNPTVGDFTGNVARMKGAAAAAREAGARRVVFPELSLPGYYPGDLLEEPGFLAAVDRGIAALELATLETPGLHWIVGAPTRNT